MHKCLNHLWKSSIGLSRDYLPRLNLLLASLVRRADLALTSPLQSLLTLISTLRRTLGRQESSPTTPRRDLSFLPAFPPSNIHFRFSDFSGLWWSASRAAWLDSLRRRGINSVAAMLIEINSACYSNAKRWRSWLQLRNWISHATRVCVCVLGIPSHLGRTFPPKWECQSLPRINSQSQWQSAIRVEIN